MTGGTRCWRPEGYEFERDLLCAGRRHDMERTGVGTLSHACHPTGRGVGNTAAPCRDQTGGPDAPRGRGKRHITDEATLVEAIDLVLKEYRVPGCSA